MRLVFYLVAILLVCSGLPGLLGLAAYIMGTAGHSMTGIGKVNISFLGFLEGLLVPFALGTYFFYLAGRCEVKPGRDVRPYIRQGGYSFLVLGLALAGLCMRVAVPYFRGESDSIALIGLAIGAPVIVALWVCGISALIVARK